MAQSGLNRAAWREPGCGSQPRQLIPVSGQVTRAVYCIRPVAAAEHDEAMYFIAGMHGQRIGHQRKHAQKARPTTLYRADPPQRDLAVTGLHIETVGREQQALIGQIQLATNSLDAALHVGSALLDDTLVDVEDQSHVAASFHAGPVQKALPRRRMAELLAVDKRQTVETGAAVLNVPVESVAACASACARGQIQCRAHQISMVVAKPAGSCACIAIAAGMKLRPR